MRVATHTTTLIRSANLSLARIAPAYPSLRLFLFLALLFNSGPALAAVNIPLSVTLSEAVTVSGLPRLILDVGGTTRYATYASGSGTATLTFTYAAQAGDVDLDGIAVSSPIDLNGGGIQDLAGNTLTTLTFTPPNTTGIKINYPSLSLDFINNDYILSDTHYASLPGFLTASGGSFTRASIGTYFDSSGALQTASTNTPRFDYDPVTHAANGILIEENRTNIVAYSAQINTGATLTGTSISADVTTAPDNTSSADKIVESAGGTTHYYQYFPTLSNNTTYIMSIFLKAAERDKVMVFSIGLGNLEGEQGYFDLTSGTRTSGTGSISAIGNGWYRIVVKITTGNPSSSPGLRIAVRDNTGASSYAGDGNSGVYAWGLQIETGAVATSYIPTTGSSLTRAADWLNIPSGSWLHASSNTVLAEYFAPSVASINNHGVFSLNNGTGADKTDIRANGTSYTTTAGTNKENLGLAINTNAINKVSKGIAFNNVAISANGSAIVADTSVILPTVTNLQIGGLDGLAGVLNLDGWIRAVKIYPARVADAQLSLLSQ